MDGMEATRRIRHAPDVLPKNKHIPIVAFTTDNGPSAKEKYLQAGLNDVIAKDGHSWPRLCAFVEQHTFVEKKSDQRILPTSSSSSSSSSS